MKLLRRIKLNSKGFSHVELVVAILVIAGITTVGVRVMAGSHADPLPSQPIAGPLSTAKTQPNGLIYSGNFGINYDGSGFNAFNAPSNYAAQYSNASPDGTKDVFFEMPAPYNTLGLITIGSTTETNIKTLPSQWSYLSPPTWSPNSQKIAIVYCKAHVTADPRAAANTSYACGSKTGIWVLNSDGTDSHSILSVTNGGIIPYVSWMPSSKTIVYTLGNSSDINKLCTINVDGTDNNCVTIALGDTNAFVLGVNGIAVGPDGKRVLLGGGTNGNVGITNIYEANINGTSLKKLTNYSGTRNSVYIYAMAWSPDGTKIVYMLSGNGSKNAGDSGYFVMNADGSDSKMISLPSGWSIYPDSLSWSYK